MSFERDRLKAENPILKEIPLNEIPIEEIHRLARDAISRCRTSVPAFGRRWEDLKGTTPVDQLSEGNYLTELIEAFLAKKWLNNLWINKKRQDGKRKRTAECESCGSELETFCPSCDRLHPKEPIIPKVYKRTILCLN